jgi:long-chain acyl-CoA synthetase
MTALRRCCPAAKLYAMYGQTEWVRVLLLRRDELDRSPGSGGVAVPGTEVSSEDQDAIEVAAGEVGEFVVRRSHVMQGYWSDPAGNGLRLPEGRWPSERVVHTGALLRTRRGQLPCGS